MSIEVATVREARPDERRSIRTLTLRAYAEYAGIMTPSAWAGLDRAVRAALDSDEPVVQIVAERDGALVGAVRLYSAAADAYAGDVERASCPEVRLLAVVPEARGQRVGRALMAACVARARATGATEL